MHNRLGRVLSQQSNIIASAREQPGKFRRRYTLDQLEAVYDASDGKCAICHTRPRGPKLALDHCHNSGKLRGLLCMDCNTGLGKFKDDVEVLDRAIAYLLKHR